MTYEARMTSIIAAFSMIVVASSAGAVPLPPEVRASDLPQAPPGVSAISGLVLGPDGKGLQNVLIKDNTLRTQTDNQGRFLLLYAPVGRSVLRVDGRVAGPGAGADYGTFEIQAWAKLSRTTPIKYPIYLAPLDHTNDVSLSDSATTETVVMNASLPGVELHIAPDTVIIDMEGQRVRKVGLAAFDPTKTPIPLPAHFSMDKFVIAQPAGACLYLRDGKPSSAYFVLPNYGHALPKARTTFWRYDPGPYGWTAYGGGTVSEDGSHVIADNGVAFSDFGSAECNPRTKSHRQNVEPINPNRVRN